MTDVPTLDAEQVDRAAAGVEVLPLFQGRRPRSATMHFTGQDDHTKRALDLDDELIVVARVRCRGITHKRDKEGVLRRAETLEVAEAYEFGEALDGKAVMDQAREESEALKRRVHGYQPDLLDQEA
jgi:hypothetical protein